MDVLRRGRRGAVAVVVGSGLVLLAGGVAAPVASAQVSARAAATPAGTQLWKSTYSGPGSHDDVASSVAYSPDGSEVFVTGSSDSAAGTADYATVAYNASTGAKLWASRYTGTDGDGGKAAAVAVDPSGKQIYVTGSSAGTGTGTDYVTIAYNATTGARLWLSRYNGPASLSDNASALAVSPNANEVFVTGTSGGGPDATAGDYATVAYDTNTGQQLWVSRYAGAGSAEDTATSLAVSPDSGTVFVTGGSGLTYETVAYNAGTGAQNWAVAGPAGEANSIAVATGGNQVFVTGTVQTDDGTEIGTVAYETGSGTRRWSRTYNGGGSAGSRGNSIVTGGYDLWVTGAAGLKFATVMYGTGGGYQRWAAVSSGLGKSDSGARQVVMGYQGPASVVITGAAGGDLVTTSYNKENGNRIWRALTPGTGIALAVNPVSGAVAATGTTDTTTATGNYLTIAYHGCTGTCR